MSKKSNVIFRLVVAYAVLLLVAAVWSWKFVNTGDEFVKLIAAWIAALTAALGAAVSLIVLSSQQEANSELEALKGDITRNVNGDLARLKGEIDRGMQLVGFAMGQVAIASVKVGSAISSYYYALAALEYGGYVDADAEAAEKLMREARPHLLDLVPEARPAFESFWQVGANIQGELHKMGDRNDKPEAMKQVWRDYARDFGDKMKAAEAALMTSREKAREGTL
jgi:DNA-binding transcriptional ArsR family regulator